VIHERTRPYAGDSRPTASGDCGPRDEHPSVRSETLRTDPFPGRPLQTVMLRIEIAPGTDTEAHRHPGLELGYVVAGHGALRTPHLPPETLTPGATFAVPRLATHSLRSDGPGPLVIVATHVVEVDLPPSRAVI
jgi:quercetin dioxygenase-like cupin family protein